MKTVFLIMSDILPLPYVKGGGVEKLMTILIEENEKNGKARFVFTSPYDEEAVKYQYKNTKIYYFNNNHISDYKIRQLIDKKWESYYRIQKIKQKIFHNRITSKVFGCSKPIMSHYYFQCYWIAKIEQANIIVIENLNITKDIIPLKRLVGEENIYFHLHYHKEEKIAERRLLPNSISISDFVKRQWAKDKSVIGKNEVLYNCINVSDYTKQMSLLIKCQLRKKLGLSDNDFVVLFCGRFMPEKGVHELLEAFSKINNKRIKLLLIGSAYYSLNNETDYSREVIEKSKKMDNVVYAGYIPNDMIPDYYAISDLQAVPSIWQEGAGMVVLEGMASGLPLVITDSGGMVEYVNDDCAIKVPIDEKLSDNLAKAIICLEKQPDLCQKMSQAGSERAKIFDKNNYYENFLDIIM